MNFDGITSGIRVDTIKQLYQDIAQYTSVICPLSEPDVINALMSSEDKNFAMLGNGLAFPNFKSEKLIDPVITFMKLETPLDIDTPDHKPIDLVIMVASPMCDGSKHLSLLSKISRMFRDEDLCAKLRSAEDDDALSAILEYPLILQEAA